MPEIQAIDEFKNELTRLGNEPEIRSQRGESMPEITVPETQSAGDLSALFDDDAADLGSLDEADLFGEDEAGSDFADEDDFNMPAGLTDGLSEELEEEDFAAEDFETEDFETEDFETEDFETEDFETEDFETEDFETEDFETEDFETEDFETEEAPLSTGDDFPGLEEFDDIPDASDNSAADIENLTDESFEDDFNLPAGLTDGLEEQFEEDLEDFSFDEDDALPEVDEPFGDFAGDAENLTELQDDETLGAGLEDFDIEEEHQNEDESFSDFSEPEDFDAGTTDFDMDFESESESFESESFESESFESESFESESFESESPADFSDAGEFDSEIEDFESDESSVAEDEFSLEDFSLDEIDGDDIEAAEFSLGDLGQEFGVDDEIESDIGHLETLDISRGDEGEDFGDAYSDDNYAIPDDEYIELKRTLGQMPRNLKLLIEELIGEKNLSGENLDKLVKALIEGRSAKEIGAIVSRITGKKVKIPAQYERRTAAEFEKEKDSFGYVFRRNFIPMFRTASIAAVILGLVMFLGYRFVYTPLHAESLYRKGYQEIALGNNVQANAYFNEAFGEWKRKNWFYDYAESFIEQKQYILAEEKYEQLIGWYPEERDAVLDYADLEYRILGKYPEAEKLLNDLLFDRITDYDARLMLGDTYMEWAREIDSSKYEDARFNYAKLLEQYGGRDQLLFRMLRYFIRTDNHVEAMNIYRAFRQNEKADIEPDIYAELAGYLIDNGQFADVREILMKARAVDEELPEIHYELARYFDIIDIPYEEQKALMAAIWLYENTNPLTRTRNGQLIDAYNRYGNILYEQELYLDAEEYYQKAAANYDEALAAGQITPEPKYGEIFSNLGDLSYYISGDYDQALTYYEKSEANEFSPEILKYKKGYIYYSREDFRDALVEFYDTAGGFSVDRALLYSTANTLFNRNDYYLAEGYYTHLLDLLVKEYSSISYLLIDEIPEHRALLENMMKVSNNLGVTKYRLYERSRDPEKNAEAMVLLTDSVEYYDKLSRNPQSLVEPDTVNLSYLNSKAVFYPVENYRLQIYQDIPKDLDKISF